VERARVDAYSQDVRDPRRSACLALGDADGCPQRNPTAPAHTSVSEAAEELVAGMRAGRIRTRSGDVYKPSAVRSYEAALRDHVVPRLGSTRLDDVQRRDVQRIADDLLAQGRDPPTIRNALMPLRVIFRRAVEDGDVAVNPCTHLRLPAVRGRRERIASPGEAEQLLAALTDPDRAVWRRPCMPACDVASSWLCAGRKSTSP
jgi:integrase